MVFEFSLKDKAQKWLNDGNETDWSVISEAFLKEYYPPTKTAEIRHKLATFQQEPDETLKEAWNRFKDLQRKCPHHNLDKWFITQAFYNGLQPHIKSTIDSSAGGVFLYKEVDKGYNFLANLAANDHNSSRTISKEKLDDDAYALLSSQVAQLSMKMDSLKSLQSSTPPMSINVMSSMAHITSSFCEMCGVQGHFLVMTVVTITVIRIRWSLQILFSRDLHTTHTLTLTTHVGEIILIFPTRTTIFTILNLHHNLPTNHLTKTRHNMLLNNCFMKGLLRTPLLVSLGLHTKVTSNKLLKMPALKNPLCLI
ncbi:uncharacterized protein LOC104896438 [Beta vulgaris subsp. vulgaris]|uniref:uncharacterized protein LOC104896438 n=1 Tax=Beta vulgaris subsp. vulgaris TaxID=3555 RepID=UPI0020369744|nr:uncharacterized protein LOC104896438 [Beta vulgaris subsp. vulgaris]XP_057251540.1 uncharacterized protein LOC104896438 [Beta vulgaris subsp. vulgaris]XP_057251541.1 uncharacterized protein LOC104896438 [Beta vulgaris subsp. vulgaris]XP_057251542.1 uncharacterized protein LOC104896438 [Beta vulgaris subsp. vulgaris]